MHSSSALVNDDKESHSKSELDFSFLKEAHLFDRCEELQRLHDALKRSVFPFSRPEFILISGRSGTGKTALARKLQQPVLSRGGFFLIGKFDQLQSFQPYAAIASAFTDFVEILLHTKEHDEIARIKKDVQNAVGLDKGLLLNMIPSLATLLGSVEESFVPKGPEARNRLKIAFVNFVRAICSFECPLVLCMDDLQWADSGSLDMIKTLAGEKKNGGLVIVGVCRDDEISLQHEFVNVLRQLEDEHNTFINHIKLGNLSEEATNELVSSVLCMDPSATKRLTQFLMETTEGNVFFTIQVLGDLCEIGLLTHDRKQKRWIWDNARFNTLHKSKDAVDLVVCRLKRLPEDTRMVLMTAACIGADFEYAMIEKIHPEVDIANSLDIAEKYSIIIRDIKSDTCKFSHDKVQQATYSLIPESEKATQHISIGRLLWNSFPSQQLQKHIFLVVDQMVRGESLLVDQAEKDSLAALCLMAGKYAVQASGFETAAEYFWRGISLLDTRHRKWRDNYKLTLDLYNAAAEAEYCSGNVERLDIALNEVLSNVPTFADKVQAYSTQVYALAARNENLKAIEIGMHVLKNLGERFPSSIRKVNIAVDILKTKLLLKGKSNKDLLSLPDIDRRDKLQSMGMLNLLCVYAHFVKPALCPFLVCRLVRLSVKYGLCTYSSFGFVMYALLCFKQGDVDNAFRYGMLSLSILERYGEAGVYLVPRVHGVFFGVLAPWKQPVASVLDNLHRAEMVAIATGDYDAAGSIMTLVANNAVISGIPFLITKQRLESFAEAAGRKKMVYHQIKIGMHLQSIHNFMGEAVDPTKLCGKFWDETKEVKPLKELQAEVQISFYYAYKTLLACYFGEFTLAISMAKMCQKYGKGKNDFLLLNVVYFYAALAALEVTRESGNKKIAKFANTAMQKVSKLKDAFPDIFTNKQMLLHAEHMSHQPGMGIEAMLINYQNSIEYAAFQGFIHEQALAHERAALALCRRGEKSLAEPFFKKAICLYKEWGSTAKVEHVVSYYRHMLT